MSAYRVEHDWCVYPATDYEEACVLLRDLLPDGCVIGHCGDIADGGARTLPFGSFARAQEQHAVRCAAVVCVMSELYEIAESVDKQECK